MQHLRNENARLKSRLALVQTTSLPPLPRQMPADPRVSAATKLRAESRKLLHGTVQDNDANTFIYSI